MTQAAKKAPYASGDYVVYPTHGVGVVEGVEVEDLGDLSVEVIVIRFAGDRMTLRVPVARAKKSGLRPICDEEEFSKAMEVLKGKAKVKRTMWSRRAQEYEAKINSGDPIQIAEVVRDLFRGADQANQSFSERQIYQSALSRFARELAAIRGVENTEAERSVEEVLMAA